MQSSRGEAPQSWRRRSNEQWGVKSQSSTFPTVKLEGRSNHHFTRCWIRFCLIFFNLTTCCFCRCSASCGTRISLVKHWHMGPHVSKMPGQRPPKIRNLPRHPRGKITSFLLIFDSIIFYINIIEICIDSTQEQNQVVRLRASHYKKYTSMMIRACHSRSRFLSCMYINDDFMTESR